MANPLLLSGFKIYICNVLLTILGSRTKGVVWFRGIKWRITYGNTTLFLSGTFSLSPKSSAS